MFVIPAARRFDPTPQNMTLHLAVPGTTDQPLCGAFAQGVAVTEADGMDLVHYERCTVCTSLAMGG